MQKVPPGFFSDSLICGLFGTRPYFFLLRCFQYKKIPKKLHYTKNKTKQNKKNKTTQKTNKQKACVHVLQPMFFITPQKATLLMSILAVSNYYTKDKS